MKRLSGVLSRVLGLTGLGVLVVALVLVLGNLAGKGTPQVSSESAAKTFQSPLPTPSGKHPLICSPDQRPVGQRAPAIKQSYPTPSSRNPPSATPAMPLQTGPRVHSVELLSSSAQQRVVGSLMALHGDRLVTPVKDDEGWTCLFVSDLKTERSKQLVTLKGSLQDLALSGDYVVWTDRTYTPGKQAPDCQPEAPAIRPGQPTQPPSTPCAAADQHSIEMHIYRFSTDQETVFADGQTRRFLSLTEDVLVWQEYRDRTWGIYGQHLATGEPFVVTKQSAGYPKVAGDWVAYVSLQDSPHLRWAAELHVFNWRTSKDKPVGSVYNAPNGSGYSIDGELLAWIRVPIDESSPGLSFESQVYDLSTGENRAVDMGRSERLTNLHLSGFLLVYLDQEGWQAVDLQNGLNMSIFPRSGTLESITGIRISGDRLVWASRDQTSGSSQIHTAQIDRE